MFFWAILQLQDDMMLVMCQNPSYANQRNEPAGTAKKKSLPIETFFSASFVMSSLTWYYTKEFNLVKLTLTCRAIVNMMMMMVQQKHFLQGVIYIMLK